MTVERRLIVLRHAKSSWKTGGPDHERPLNKRGRRDAPRVGEVLVDVGWSPQRVLCSTAARTRETWRRMEDAFDPAPEVSFHPELYLAGPTEVEAIARELPAEITSVMLIGHNNGWEEVVTWLSGRHERMTTCNAALLSAEGSSWPEALDRTPGWTLHRILRPKELD